MARLLLTALCAALCAAVLSKPAEAACLAFTSAPKTFQGMKLVLNRRFDKRSDGIVLKYGGQGQVLSVFKYPRNRKGITGETLSAELDGAAVAVEAAAKQRGDEILSKDTLEDWWVEDVVFQGRTLTATYRQYNAQAFEYVGLSHKRGCLFEVRYTNVKDGNGRLSLKRFKWYVREAVKRFR
ncbi:MAG: hypothetical protein ACR2PM_02845 [Hyphomicrobiales bacterium]